MCVGGGEGVFLRWKTPMLDNRNASQSNTTTNMHVDFETTSKTEPYGSVL